MNVSRQTTTHNNSLIVILWGLIFAKCFTLEYLVKVYAVPINSALYIWTLTLTMATIATFVFLRIKAQESSFQKSLRRNLVIWGTSAIAMLIALLIAFISQSINPYSIPALLAAFLGASYFFQARINRSLSDTISGSGWLIGSGILFVQSAVESLILFAFLILALSVLPVVIQMIRLKQTRK
ncbi:MAG TPA: hypothetical protein DEA16_02620 [Opitutae bacterium]|jgi:hypothetical protein|nr:hypothetical protein [Opitutae bacterium]